MHRLLAAAMMLTCALATGTFAGKKIHVLDASQVNLFKEPQRVKRMLRVMYALGHEYDKTLKRQEMGLSEPTPTPWVDKVLDSRPKQDDRPFSHLDIALVRGSLPNRTPAELQALFEDAEQENWDELNRPFTAVEKSRFWLFRYAMISRIAMKNSTLSQEKFLFNLAADLIGKAAANILLNRYDKFISEFQSEMDALETKG